MAFAKVCCVATVMRVEAFPSDSVADIAQKFEIRVGGVCGVGQASQAEQKKLGLACAHREPFLVHLALPNPANRCALNHARTHLLLKSSAFRYCQKIRRGAFDLIQNMVPDLVILKHKRE
jgi:hypothetical protein